MISFKQKRLWFLVCICIATIALAGCGKKANTSAGNTKAVETSEKGAVPSGPSSRPISEERTFYGFERDLAGWEVPMWAESKSDYVAQGVVVSKDEAVEGDASMKVMTDFPGGNWTCALVEIQQYLDLSAYRVVSLDIYLPKDAPMGLNANIILTVGENWKFVEMNRSLPLVPGEWTTITASIEPGSYDWKRVVPDAKFAQDVRKIAIRIVSNRKPKYSGPIYVDNIRVGR